MDVHLKENQPQLEQNSNVSEKSGSKKPIKFKEKKGNLTKLKSSERSSSELDLRAASMRSQIEQKLIEIEAGLHTQRSSFEDSTVKSEVDNAQTVDAKRSRSCSMYEKKEMLISRLQEELNIAQKALKLKNEEVAKLAKVRDEIGVEIEELTASLFEEANKMVQDAYSKQTMYEKAAREAHMNFKVLQEEVKALKVLIQDSLPYKLNSITSTSSKMSDENQSPNFKQTSENASEVTSSGGFIYKRKLQYEPDPVMHFEFVSWRENPKLDKHHLFIERIYDEDIIPCMNFKNQELSKKVLAVMENNAIEIENISGMRPLPKMCALLEVPRFCYYRMAVGENESYYISTFSRNRIIAVCNLFCYLKYIENGLVTDSANEVYYEILKLRKAISVARLGLLEENDSKD